MKYFPIFRPGKHIDSKGNEHNFTEDAVKKLVDDYNANKDNYDVPLVKGHPATDDPAYGWVKSLKYENGKVYALPKDLDPTFQEEVNKKRYKYVSIKIGNDGKLKHVGFLGAENPAIKQLGEVSFCEFDGEGTTTPLETIDFVFSEKKDDLDIKTEVSKYFAEFKSEMTAELKSAITNLTKEFKENQNNSNKSGEDMDKNNKKDLFMQKVRDKFGDNTATELAKVFNEVFSGMEFNEVHEPDEKDKRIAELERINRQNGYKEFTESTELTPKQKKIAVELLEIAGNSNQEIEFSENGSTKKSSILDLTKDFLKSVKNPDLTKNILPGGSYSQGSEPSLDDFEKAAKEVYGE